MKPSTDRLARAALVGAVGGAIVALVLGVPKAFSLAALVCGFGVTAWAGSILLSQSIKRAQSHVNAAPGWTESGARRAFVLLGTCGATGMATSAFVLLA